LVVSKARNGDHGSVVGCVRVCVLSYGVVKKAEKRRGTGQVSLLSPSTTHTLCTSPCPDRMLPGPRPVATLNSKFCI
jgi:hypothetical protein